MKEEKYRKEVFQEREETASVWLPGRYEGSCFFAFRFFFDFFLFAEDDDEVAFNLSSERESGSTKPPNTQTGSGESMTSKFHISISGLNVPTATKFPTPDADVCDIS